MRKTRWMMISVVMVTPNLTSAPRSKKPNSRARTCSTIPNLKDNLSMVQVLNSNSKIIGKIIPLIITFYVNR
jgi:hypothetical protein